MNNCPFCEIVVGDSAQKIVWSNDHLAAFLTKRPQKRGHLLVIPKKHVDYFFDLPQEIYDELFDVAWKLAPLMKKELNAVRIGLAVEGFGVGHAHLHLIPMYERGDLDPALAHDAPQEELDAMTEIYQRIFANV